jgi:hypothetical protein
MTGALGVAGALLGILVQTALGLGWLVTRRPRLHRGAVLRVTLWGALFGLGSLLFQRWGLRLSGAPEGVVPLYMTLGLWGPLGEGAKLAALLPAFTRRELRGPLEAITAVTVVSCIFGLQRALHTLLTVPGLSRMQVAGLLLAMPAQLLVSSPWAFMLGRSYQRSNPRSGFLPAWLASVVLDGVVAYLVAQQRAAALAAVGVLLAGMLLLAVLARDTLRPGAAKMRLRRVGSGAGVDLRELLARKDAPVKLRWVLVGVLVNQGSLLCALVGAVLLGNYLGVDFALIEETSNASLKPVLFLISAGLLAFPTAGFLVTRASGVSTLLEPALASVLALVGLGLVMGVAAPVVLAVVIACAPVALILSCAGAWFGLR